MAKTIKTAPEIVSIDVKFINGQIVDIKTNEPVKFINHSKAKLLILSDCLIGEEVSDLGIPQNSEQKELEIQRANNILSYKKVLACGTHLFFEMKGKIFTVELLEDLYFFERKEAVESRKFGIFDCQCKILNIEKDIKGKSLNEIYKLAFVKIFYNDGAPSVNAFDRFFKSESLSKQSVIRMFLEDKKIAWEKVPY